jgi:hypothetical protein
LFKLRQTLLKELAAFLLFLTRVFLEFLQPLAHNLEAPCFFIVFKLNSLVARVLLHLVLHSVKHGVLFQLLDVLGALGPTAVHDRPLQHKCVYLILENLRAV